MAPRLENWKNSFSEPDFTECASHYWPINETTIPDPSQFSELAALEAWEADLRRVLLLSKVEGS